MTLFERFMSKTTPTAGCWEWTGAKISNGYGELSYKNAPAYAHRIAFALFVGPIPFGQVICHSCDNPGCVRPSHLWAGSYQDNTKDAIAKGRVKNPPAPMKLVVCARGHERTSENLTRRACRLCVNLVQNAKRRSN